MAWRCGSKKTDGKVCRSSVATKGAKCQHHKRAKAKKKTPRKATSKAAPRCRPAKSARCAANTACGKRCKQFSAGKSKFCGVHKGGARKKTARRNPQEAFSQLQDRWSLPKLPSHVIR